MLDGPEFGMGVVYKGVPRKSLNQMSYGGFVLASPNTTWILYKVSSRAHDAIDPLHRILDPPFIYVPIIDNIDGLSSGGFQKLGPFSRVPLKRIVVHHFRAP